jgi:hypothetical protein
MDSNVGDWALDAIKIILELRSELRTFVRHECMQTRGLVKLALLYCTNDWDVFWKEMSNLVSLSNESPDQPFFLLESFEDLKWEGKEALLLNLLRQRNLGFARHLLESFFMGFGKKFDLNISIEPIDWWLKWMEEVKGDRERGFWFCDRLAYFWTTCTVQSNNISIIQEFNLQESPFRPLLSEYFLPKISSLTTDMLSEGAVSFLIANLSRADENTESILGSAATESFAQQRLLPLLSSAAEPLRTNVREELRLAGQRHGRRYISENS